MYKISLLPENCIVMKKKWDFKQRVIVKFTQSQRNRGYKKYNFE